METSRKYSMLAEVSTDKLEPWSASKSLILLVNKILQVKFNSYTTSFAINLYAHIHNNY